MIIFKWTATALALALLALPGAAFAQGGAAGDQYTENAPSASGGGGSGGNVQGSTDGSSPSGATSTGGGGNGGPLKSSTLGKFEKGGKDGNAAKNLAQQTAPNSQALDDAAAAAQRGAAGTSVFDAPSNSTSSDGGMGIALPIILGVVLLGGIAYAVIRRRGDSGRPGPRPTSGLRNRLRLRRPDAPERG